MTDIIYDSCRSFSVNDSIFDDVRDNYSDFSQWFKKCNDLNRTVVKSGGKSAIAILKYKSSSIKICTFIVSKHQRRHGVGKALMAELFDHAKMMGKEELYLSVLNTNKNFIKFCEHVGFKLQSTDGTNLIFNYKF